MAFYGAQTERVPLPTIAHFVSCTDRKTILSDPFLRSDIDQKMLRGGGWFFSGNMCDPDRAIGKGPNRLHEIADAVQARFTAVDDRRRGKCRRCHKQCRNDEKELFHLLAPFLSPCLHSVRSRHGMRVQGGRRQQPQFSRAFLSCWG
jgi:hypothetical protein